MVEIDGRDSGERTRHTVNDSKIADKIRKLIALASANPSPEEAATAFAAAQEIATRAGLDLDDLAAEDTARIPPPPRGVEPITDRTIDTSARTRVAWRIVIAQAAAAANGCGIYTVGGAIVCYGQTSDLDTAAAIYAVIVAQVEAMAGRAVAAYRASPETDPRWDPSPRVWGASWRLGCAHTIARRLPARASTVEKARAELPRGADGRQSPGALVRVDAAAGYVAAVAAAVGTYAGRLGLRSAGRIGRASSASGYQAGRTAGDGIGIGATRALGRGQA